jgi:hypothetical protein
MYTLRFPRVLKVRYDKGWDEAFTETELKELIANYQEARRFKRKDHLALEQGEANKGELTITKDSKKKIHFDD